MVNLQDNLFEITGPVGRLECAMLDADPNQTKPVALLCHPNSAEGGTMNNKVVTTLARAMRDAAMTSVRFNFRGVGASDGHYSDGVGEADDCYAVAQWIRQQRPHSPLLLAGFSMGAYVALRATSLMSESPIAMISIAPAVSRRDFSELTPVTCPWLIVQGGEDEVVPSEQVGSWVSSLPKSVQYKTIMGASHFFHGYLLDLKRIVGAFLAPVNDNHSQ